MSMCQKVGVSLQTIEWKVCCQCVRMLVNLFKRLNGTLLLPCRRVDVTLEPKKKIKNQKKKKTEKNQQKTKQKQKTATKFPFHAVFLSRVSDKLLPIR